MRNANNFTTADWSGDWQALKRLIPYFLEFKGRVLGAMLFLILAKIASVTIPIVLKYIVDDLDNPTSQIAVIPLSLLLAYGLLRFGTVLFGELRDAVFARVTERAMRRVGLEVFEHLHKMELEYHLSRRTGGVSRDIERGTTGISFLLRFMLFNIIPTLLEIGLIAAILFFNYSIWFALIICISVFIYILFSVIVTEWRTKFVRETNTMDSLSNTRAIDSLLNFETVKYFTNEKFEALEYDKNLANWEKARLKNRLSLVVLNSGQGLIIASSVTLMMILATQQVVTNAMTLGDLVLINAYMIQLFIPLNFLGFVYREIKNALTNIEKMLEILKQKPKINDTSTAKILSTKNSTVTFDNVSFGYNNDRNILSNVSFTVPNGQKIAIVGPSGAGKSTIARLLFRFYDVNNGRITINGHDIRDFTQTSLRQSIGVVPQDTVLFNDSLLYNIQYGNPKANKNEIDKVIQLAHLESFIEQLPAGLNTVVGERGLKLSGGEKQRVAIARTLLKNPSIMVFDEATSSLDSHSEQNILNALNSAAENRTTLAIAHRLSTITDADQIIVLQQGKIVEQGKHSQLLKEAGLYSTLWLSQQQDTDNQLVKPSSA